jgi:hypothetical protein
LRTLGARRFVKQDVGLLLVGPDHALHFKFQAFGIEVGRGVDEGLSPHTDMPLLDQARTDTARPEAL